MKRTNCTELFLRYREIARGVWNLGFFPFAECRQWESERAYDAAIARLFEGMVLRPLGLGSRVALTHWPGETANFRVEIASENVELLVDENPPETGIHVWGRPILKLRQSGSQLRFVNFFDWYQLGVRDFRLFEVLIEGMDERPDLVGRHGLVEIESTVVWLLEDEGDETE